MYVNTLLNIRYMRYVFCVIFRDGSRDVSIYDIRSFSSPIFSSTIDHHQLAQPILFYHPSQSVLILTGKNDNSIKFLEFSNTLDSFLYLNEYKCQKSHKGITAKYSNNNQEFPILYKMSTETVICTYIRVLLRLFPIYLLYVGCILYYRELIHYD